MQRGSKMVKNEGNCRKTLHSLNISVRILMLEEYDIESGS